MTTFLISPASLHGKRAQQLLGRRRSLALWGQLRSDDGVELDSVFSFISTLYFRGKSTYARHFGDHRSVGGPAQVIVPGLGLLPPSRSIGTSEMRKMRRTKVDPKRPSYRKPFERDVLQLATQEPQRRFVLLGSLATGKYLDILLPALGARLYCPKVFFGMGDMKRGSVLLQAAAANQELEYVEVERELAERRALAKGKGV